MLHTLVTKLLFVMVFGETSTLTKCEIQIASHLLLAWYRSGSLQPDRCDNFITMDWLVCSTSGVHLISRWPKNQTFEPAGSSSFVVQRFTIVQLVFSLIEQNPPNS